MPDISSLKGTGIHENRRGGIMLSSQKWKLSIVLFFVVILAGVCVLALANAQQTAKTSTPVKLPRIVDVGADKCVPCVMMAPELESLKKEYEGVLEVQFVDVWKYPQEANKYGVRAIPTQIFYDANGRELGRHLGFISKDDILAKFKDLGIMIAKVPPKRK
jgi:thioredoxin 1